MSDSLRPYGHSSSGSSVLGTLQARILVWVAIPFTRGTSWPRDQTWVSCVVGRFFTIWATSKTHYSVKLQLKCYKFPYNFPDSHSPYSGTDVRIQGFPLMIRVILDPGLRCKSKNTSCSHGQRSLAGCSPRGHKESDVTEQQSTAQPEKLTTTIWATLPI